MNTRFIEKRVILCGLVIVALGAAVYANSLGAAFVFDDDNGLARVRSCGSIGELLATRRPLVSLTLAMNLAYAGVDESGRPDPSGFHVFNIAVHVAAALLLFGLVRRTLALVEGTRPTATRIAFVTSLLWTVHPLQTESVTYTIQRSESLMALFLFATLYCTLRGTRGSPIWLGASVACCALGMTSKGIMVTAPLVVLIYDRVFLASSFREIFEKRWWLHALLFASISILALAGVWKGIFRSDAPGRTVGFGLAVISPWEYFLCQPESLLTYLRLTFWPRGQVLDYGYEPVSFAAALPGGIVIFGLLCASAWALWKLPRVGFLAGAFFLILAPTSSFIPIKDVTFEHRMYAPLAPLLLLAVLGARALLERLAAKSSSELIAVVLAGVAVVGYGASTVARNTVYADSIILWRDNLAKTPENPRVMVNLGFYLGRVGEYDEATRLLARAVELRPRFARAHREYGRVLIVTRRAQLAVEHLEIAASLERNNGELFHLLGIAYDQAKRPGKARAALEKALQLHRSVPPDTMAKLHTDLGHVHRVAGRLPDAERQLRLALQRDAESLIARKLLAGVLAQQSKHAEAIAVCRQVLARDPNVVLERLMLAELLMITHSLQQAARECREVLRRVPGHPDALRLQERIRSLRSNRN